MSFKVKKELNNKVIDYIKANPKFLVGSADNLKALADMFQITMDRVEHMVRKARYGNPDYAASKEIDYQSKKVEEPRLPQHDLALRRKAQELSDLKRRYDLLLSDFDGLKESYDDLLEVSNIVANPHPIVPTRDNLGEATALVVCSDWHLAERVRPSTVFGLNETSPDIMTARVDKLAINTIKLVNKERQDVIIDNLLLALLGDFLNSFLHDHDVQENFMAPMEELVFARDLLVSYIAYLRDNGNFKKITIITARGNHPRTTFKMSSSTDYKMNFEAVLYRMLATHFAKDSTIEFVIPDSELGYIEVYGKTIRWFHGHQVSFGGGIGGLTIPLNKRLLRWDQNRRADLNIMGHFHEFSMPTKNCLLNGSLVGYNAYSQNLGFAFEPPVQTFQLIDRDKWLTTRMPIFCQ